MTVIQFFLRSNNDKAKTHVLYCRITLNKTTAEFSTKEKVNKTDWDQQNQKHKSKDKNKDRYILSLIETMTYKIKTKAIHLLGEITAKELLDQMQNKPKETVLLVNLIEKYISDIVASDRSAAGTIRNHKIKLQNLILFQSYAKIKFSEETFNLVTAEKFKDWFLVHKATTNVSTANRNVLFYKNALQYAAKKGLIKTFALSLFIGEKDKIQDPIYLTEIEVLSLISHEFQSPMLAKVKDLYLFQITTGLSFSDLWSKFVIETTPSGKVLTGSRAKNGQAFFVPLDPVAEMLLEKYENKLPIYCNAVYNRILKEIAAILSIDKKLTTHTGRKTFATLQDSKGWSRESIALMLGHRSVKTTEMYYIGHSFARIENEFKNRV